MRRPPMRRRAMAKPGLLFRIQTLGARDGSGLGPEAPQERCEQSGKRIYSTMEAAQEAARLWGQHNQTRAIAYECRHCGGFHLTHAEWATHAA